MGGISFMHGTVLVLVIGIPVALVCGLVWLVRRSAAQSRSRASSAGVSPGVDPSARLQQLDNLLQQGRISSEEYERQRAAVIAGV